MGSERLIKIVDVGVRVSGFRFQVSGFRLQVSGFDSIVPPSRSAGGKPFAIRNKNEIKIKTIWIYLRVFFHHPGWELS